MKKTGIADRSVEGSTLGMVMVIMVIVGVLGGSLIHFGMVLSMESSRHVSRGEAFWTAEAGIEHAKALAWERRYDHGMTEVFPSSESRTWGGTTAFGDYTVTVEEQSSNPPQYRVESDSTSRGGQRKIIEVLLRQENAISMGLFGNDLLELKSKVFIYSYSSEVGSIPTPDDSTGEASVGSNSHISIQALSPDIIDGSVLLGADESGLTTAVLDGQGTDIGIIMDNTQEMGHIDPDPLRLYGDTTNPLDLAWDYYWASGGQNDNDLSALITNNRIRVSPQQEGTLTSGSYYLNEIDIRAQGTLTVDVTNGPVHIYLNGSFLAAPNSAIFLVGGTSMDFQVIAKGDVDDEIRLLPATSFEGFIYAPRMTAHIAPRGDFYGAVWAGNSEIWPGGDIYIDTSIYGYDTFDAYRLVVTGWRQISL